MPAPLYPARLWPMIWLIMALGLLALGGVSFLFLRDLARGETEPRTVADQPRSSDLGPLRMRDVEGALRQRAIATPQRREEPVRVDAPVIVRTAPKRPCRGQPFTIILAHPDRTVTYEFRSDPKEPWRTAAGDRIEITAVGRDLLRVELRTLNRQGQPSPVIRRTWTPTGPAPAIAVVKPPAAIPFYQEVIFDRNSASATVGFEFRDHAQMAFLSSFQADPNAAHLRTFVQRIEAVHLDRAADAVETSLNRLLRQARGATFRIELTTDGNMASFKGKPEALAVAEQVPGRSLLLTSTLDADGWKELATLTFFQPPKKLPPGGQWSRDEEHAWGPLGRWTGKIVYTAPVKVGKWRRYHYRHLLAYHPPKSGLTELPLLLEARQFRLLRAEGDIDYDPVRRRVVAAEEDFAVHGIFSAGALGVTVPVEGVEEQRFRVRLLDEVPDDWRRVKGPVKR